MEIRLNIQHGRRNDLLVVLNRSEIADAHLHISSRDEFMELPGLTRHRLPSPKERGDNKKLKRPVLEHLEAMGLHGNVEAPSPVIAIGNRNLGNNHGFVAWQKNQVFHIKDDPLDYDTYSCLVMDTNGYLSIRDLTFNKAKDSIYENGRCIADQTKWATFGQHILRSGDIVPIQEIIGQFYDIRHVLAFDRKQEVSKEKDPIYKKYHDGKSVNDAIYNDYPNSFAKNAWRALKNGIPRATYLHNCVGLSKDQVFILQREGTIEEIAQWLAEAGAEDGLIFDNGGSVFTWAWFVDSFKGGFLFTAPDFRPNSSAILAFVLNIPLQTDLPSSSISPSVR